LAQAHEPAQFAPNLASLRLAKLKFFGEVIRPGRDVLFAPQQTQKSIFKIHQVMGGERAGKTSGAPSAISLPPTRLYPAAQAPTTQTLKKSRRCGGM
jgi:hypothetical protein